MSHTAFFYGTLMAPPVLRRVIYGQHASTLDTNSLTVRPAILHKYQRHKVHNADYPAILPSSTPHSCVRGSLVTGLTDGDMWRLDIFEGDEYERRKVCVTLPKTNPNPNLNSNPNPNPHQSNSKTTSQDSDRGKGEEEGDEERKGEENEEQVVMEEQTVAAETYIWTAPAHRLESQEWDFDEFVREKMGRWVGGGPGVEDEGFRDVDKAVSAVAAQDQDPTGGRGFNGDITRVLDANPL